MRNFAILVLMAVSAIMSLSCEEEVQPAHVQGEFQVNPGSTFDIDGDLSEKGSKYFGSCKKEGDLFKFELGDDDKTHVSGSNEFYVSVYGIVGPPEEGVLDGDGEPKDDDSLYTTFSQVQIVNTNSFAVVGSDWEDQCDVELWAKSVKGELTPETDSGGGLRKFQHYVRINCTGISVEASSSQDAILNSFSAELYFSNCG